MPKALKSCPKSNKSPNLVTLLLSRILQYLYVAQVTQSDNFKMIFRKQKLLLKFSGYVLIVSTTIYPNWAYFTKLTYFYDMK